MLDVITEQYMEPHRFYHDLSHPVNMFYRAKELGLRLSNKQIFAIWFHDVIYDVPLPGRKLRQSNEERSALFAVDTLLAQGLTAGFVGKVAGMIRATEKVLAPGVPELTEEQWVVVGLDMYDFGTLQFFEHTPKIRREMAHLSDSEWREGRSKFLRMMIDKEYIIALPFFEEVCRYRPLQPQSDKRGVSPVSMCELWHCEAHANINAELRSL